MTDAASASAPPGTPPFLGGRSEAARLIREADWSNHALGSPGTWPDALRVALGLVLESPESMILAWGPELHFFFNDTYFPLLGPRLSWAMGAPFREVWADAWEQAKPIIDEAFAGRAQRFVDLPWTLDTDRGAKETFWSFSYSRVFDADGAVAGLFIFTNETTARVNSDRRLAAEIARQRKLLQHMPGFAAVLRGPEHVFDYVNDAYVAIAGNRDFIGRGVRTVFPELVGQGFYELLDGVYATGQPFTARAMPIRLAGEEQDRFIDLLYKAIRDDAGAVIGIFVGGYDVTERLRAEGALEAANAGLAERVAAALAEQGRIEEALRQSQKMEAVGQLTGGLAHDFNNLLAGISGSLELMQARIGQGRLGEIDRYMSAAQGATRRAAALTHRLLAFSRRQTLDPKPTDVNRLVAEMEELIRRTVGPTVTIETVGAAGPWTVLIDPPQLENALLNLCINARDAMPDGGRITIETANVRLDDRTARAVDMPPGSYLTLSVSDTGTGMSADVIARAFEPFFTTKPIGQGTGLGLSMIYGFVRQSGGQVRIYSEMGEGTTLRLYLPRHADALLEPEAAIPAGEAPQAGQGRTVLVVDDEPTVRMLVTEILEELGYVAIEAVDGAGGLAVLQSDVRLDLLVTDVGLPGGMNGRQMAEAGRVVRPGLKVLFITGYAENAVLGHGHLEPGMQVMTKPFAMEALAGRIDDLIKAN
ncbi:MAG: ATP-binding protein [Methylobacterium sp.]